MLSPKFFASAVLALAVGATAQSCSYTDQSLSPLFYSTSQFWYRGQPIWCYALGTYVPTRYVEEVHIVDAIQPVRSDGTLAGDLIFSSTPCDPVYSPAVRIRKVTVEDSTPFNSIKDFDVALALGSATVDSVRNLPIVPKFSQIIEAEKGADTPMTSSGWFKGGQLAYFDFGRVPFYNSNDRPDIWVPTGSAIQIYSEGQAAGLPIVDIINDNQKYTGFYSLKQVSVTGFRYIANTVTSADSLPGNATLLNGAPVLICPFAHFQLSPDSTLKVQIESVADGKNNTVTPEATVAPENENYPVDLVPPPNSIGTSEKGAPFLEEFLGFMKDMNALIIYMNRAVMCENHPPGIIRYLRQTRIKNLEIIPQIVTLLFARLVDPVNDNANQLSLEVAMAKLRSGVTKVKKYVNMVGKRCPLSL
ncbi:hypothetical protein HDU96_010719 [Phlyctochytrium bullatum]|nr:hypothetical protein HDU96_010719 [Phlyctochytrium bullatum]